MLCFNVFREYVRDVTENPRDFVLLHVMLTAHARGCKDATRKFSCISPFQEIQVDYDERDSAGAFRNRKRNIDYNS